MNEVADLGTIDGDVLVFGGVVSNAHAFAALLRLAGKRGVEPRQMVSTGDIAAYCGQPAQRSHARLRHCARDRLVAKPGGAAAGAAQNGDCIPTR